jgi:hypothetical protein
MTDDEIDYSDIPELDDSFFKNAILQMPDRRYKSGFKYFKKVNKVFKEIKGDPWFH